MIIRSLGFVTVVVAMLVGGNGRAFGQGYPPPPPPAGGPDGAAPAQRQGLVSKGLKVGINSAAMSFSVDLPDQVNNGRSFGLALGAFGVLAVGPQTSLQVEALYTQKGAQQTVDGADAKFVINLDYLEGVGLIRYDLADQGTTRPFIFAGGAASLNIGAEGVASGDDVDDPGTDDFSDVTSDIDIALVVGGGAELGMSGGGAITVDVRYVHGLLNVDDSDDDVTIKNNVVSVMVGYAI